MRTKTYRIPTWEGTMDTVCDFLSYDHRENVWFNKRSSCPRNEEQCQHCWKQHEEDRLHVVVEVIKQAKRYEL